MSSTLGSILGIPAALDTRCPPCCRVLSARAPQEPAAPSFPAPAGTPCTASSSCPSASTRAALLPLAWGFCLIPHYLPLNRLSVLGLAQCSLGSSSSETIMFLHQIFYQGLKARISSWPTLVLGECCCLLSSSSCCSFSFCSSTGICQPAAEDTAHYVLAWSRQAPSKNPRVTKFWCSWFCWEV